jgi:hypothetical protein
MRLACESATHVIAKLWYRRAVTQTVDPFWFQAFGRVLSIELRRNGTRTDDPDAAEGSQSQYDGTCKQLRNAAAYVDDVDSGVLDRIQSSGWGSGFGVQPDRASKQVDQAIRRQTGS